jgi:hypothetical protein
MIGDIHGNNNLAAAYQNFGVCPYHACKCSWEDLNAEALSCEFATIAIFQHHKVVSFDMGRTASRDVMKKFDIMGLIPFGRREIYCLI